MEWQSTYSVGIEEIDNQHRELLGHFSTIGEAMVSKKSWSDVHFEIVKLKEFAHFHFRFEDALMSLYGCPQRERHNEIHVQFLREIESYERSSLRRQNDKEVMQLFTDWLVKHIQGDDRVYAHRIISGAKVVLTL
ncbi:MAG: hemerythrin family protein [Sulfuritalea sp.]|jgi:hemerythrin-like metal-binding protein|nr:hemerythrin family protein [Sulfuritalea sp.]